MSAICIHTKESSRKRAYIFHGIREMSYKIVFSVAKVGKIEIFWSLHPIAATARYLHVQK